MPDDRGQNRFGEKPKVNPSLRGDFPCSTDSRGNNARRGNRTADGIEAALCACPSVRKGGSMVRTKCLAMFTIAAMLVGCVSSGGSYQSDSVTTVDLTKANYRVIKSSAVGTSYGFKLFCIIPFSSPSNARAMNDLRSQAPMEGKATAVANVTQDSSNIWLLLFSLQKLTISGDIVEFIDEGAAAGETQDAS